MNSPGETKSKAALDEAELILGMAHPDLVPLLDTLAYDYHSCAKFDSAEECYLRAIAIVEKDKGHESLLLVPRLHNLAVLYRIQDKFQEAEAIYKRSLELTAAACSNILDAATQMNYLAGLYFAWGKPTDAESLVKDSIKIYQDELGEGHEYEAFCLMGLAFIYRQQGKELEAKECFSKCEKQMKGAPRLEYLESFQDITHSLFHLARSHYRQGRFDDALVLFRYALLSETWELWPYHPFVAQSLQLLADLYFAQSMFAEAEHLYQQALQLRMNVLGPEHITVAVSANSLAKLLQKLRRYDEAAQMYALTIAIRQCSAYPPQYAQTLSAFAEMERERGENSHADELDAQAKNILDTYRPTL